MFLSFFSRSSRPSAPSPKAKSKSVKRRRRGPRGFSLLEAMISGALLTISVSGTLSAYSNVAAQYQNQRHTTQAMNIAEGTLEDLLLRFNGDTEIAPGSHGPLNFDRDGEIQGGAGTYQATWTVLPHPIDGIRTIVVTVAWDSMLGPRTLVLTTDRS